MKVGINMKKIIMFLVFIILLFFCENVYAEEWTCEYKFKEKTTDSSKAPYYYLSFTADSSTGVKNDTITITVNGKEVYKGKGYDITGSTRKTAEKTSPYNIKIFVPTDVLSSYIKSNGNTASSSGCKVCPDPLKFKAFLSDQHGQPYDSSVINSSYTGMTIKPYTYIQFDSNNTNQNRTVDRTICKSNIPDSEITCKGNTKGKCPEGQTCVTDETGQYAHYYCKQNSDVEESCPMNEYLVKDNSKKDSQNYFKVGVVYEKQNGKYIPRIVSVDNSNGANSARREDDPNAKEYKFIFSKIVANVEVKSVLTVPYINKCSEDDPSKYTSTNVTGMSDEEAIKHVDTIIHEATNPSQDIINKKRTCKEILGNNLTNVVKAGIRAVQVIGAIIAIVKGMMVLLPAIIAKDADGLKKASKTLITMAIILAVIFLLPGLLRFIGKVAGFDISCLL